MVDLTLQQRLANLAKITESERDAARAYREPVEGGLEALGSDELEALAERVEPQLSNDDVAALISIEARDFVIGFEVGGRKDYDNKYCHPIWPGGGSGITIAIGYDLGFQSADGFRKTWGGLIPDAVIDRLSGSLGLTGERARAKLSGLRDIVVPWDVALEVYRLSTMPRYGRMVLEAFPNAKTLHPHSFGALFSLVFNRGAAMAGAKRAEMRNIRDLMGKKEFPPVPNQFREMKRWWTGQGLDGLLRRRDAEAVLFQRGLELAKGAGAGTSLESAAGDGLEAADVDGEVTAYVEGEASARPESLEATAAWEGVKWATDNESPDYMHIVDRSLKDQPFELNAADVELLLRANSFEPETKNQRIVIALRGCVLVSDLTGAKTVPKQVELDKLTLMDKRPDHTNYLCVIGVYDLSTRRLSGFMASTVPTRHSVYTYKTTKKFGNMVPTGRYRFEVGVHLRSNPDESRHIPGCLIENGRQKAVLRSTNDLRYDVKDDWQNQPLHGDNLHPAKSDGYGSAKFSSQGCLVVSGTYQRDSDTHVGEWAAFRTALGLGKPSSKDHGKIFDVILVTGLEAALAHHFNGEGVDLSDERARAQLVRLRQGSKGPRVARLQAALNLPQTGEMDHRTVKALADRQGKDLGWRDGIYSLQMDKLLKLKVMEDVPTGPMVVAAAPNGTGAKTSLESVAPGSSPDQLEGLYYELGMRSRMAWSDPSSVTAKELPYSESVYLELSWGDVAGYGRRIFNRVERAARGIICGDSSEDEADRQRIRQLIDDGAAKGRDALRTALSTILTAKLFLPPPVADTVADLIVSRVVVPAVGEVGQMAVQVGQSMKPVIDETCRAWAAQAKVEPDPIAPPRPAVVATSTPASAGQAAAGRSGGRT